MRTPALSTIYLDNERISLMGDPRPVVAKILAAGGRTPDSVIVERNASSTPSRGTPLGLADVVDRTAEPTKAIYLTCKPKARTAESQAPGSLVAWPMHGRQDQPRRGPLPASPATPPGNAPVGPGDEPEWGL
ncbi:MAG: hypothetical protein AABY18_07825 [Candidatus Thermoplasmatota archaeon]